MAGYRAPVADILAALDVAGLDDLLGLERFGHVDRSTIEVALAEFGRFATEVIAPTDRTGDVTGVRLDRGTGSVVVPEEFSKAYDGLVDGGWTALAFPEDWGGGGFPGLVGMAVQDMLASANLSLSLNPVLTQSAIELLLTWGSESQRSRFLPRLLTGEWSGTMNLTEPEAGSDLSRIRTTAEPDGEAWRLSGTKIFITWGDHDLSKNIVHLVLARTPDAPAGTRGLSLFLVPRLLVDKNGQAGAKNAITCQRVEEKLGLHASPTCVLDFDGATAELVGPEHSGMRAMFTMMNTARLSIGMQGPSVGEAAYQQALEYAHERRQGKAPGWTGPDASLIVEHPDVARMLLTMRVLTLAGRMLVYEATGYKDRSRHAGDDDARALAQEYLDLLTPVAKAWSTDIGVQVASLGIQVFGGLGFIEGTGIAQHWRDSRIAPIYEGTNGIQAIDLVTRKLPREGGRFLRRFIDEIAGTLGTYRDDPDLAESIEILGEALGALGTATDWMVARTADAPSDVLAGASAYLELFGTTVGGWLMVRRALAGRDRSDPRSALECRFYATEILARAPGLLRPITAGAQRLDGVLTDPGR